MVSVNPDKNFRFGTIKTLHGEIKFPAFMPDATYGTINSISYNDLEQTGIKSIVTNTLHLERNLGSNFISNQGGFHKYVNWNLPVLTDSGGFQVFSLIHRRNYKQNKITEAGCSFLDNKTGKYFFLSPESSQHIQHLIGSDIRVVLDEPVIENASPLTIKNSIKKTTMWAKRAKTEFCNILDIAEDNFESYKSRPLLTAVIQGANNFDLRKQSIDELTEIGFDIYGFGGLPLLTKRSWDYTHKGGLHRELLHFVAENLPKDKIRYALGVGTPDDMIFAIKHGWDIFDTVLPTRNARHGYLYVSSGEGDKQYDSYDVLHIKNLKYVEDSNPIDSKCDCIACKSVSRSFLRYLLKIKDASGFRIATIHNLTFYSNMFKRYVV